MINYQLANGRTVRIPEEQFFKMTDQDLKDLEGSNYGYVVNDPFYDSALDDNSLPTIILDDIEIIDEIELDEDIDLE